MENIAVELEGKRERAIIFQYFTSYHLHFSPDMFQNALVIFAYSAAACMIAEANSLAGK